MGLSKAQLLARLQELQIDFFQYEHPVVLTVEAQAKYVGHLKGGLSKNLFLKDKKQRFYIVSALAETKVDLKVLSRRLGLGKGGLRMAPEESLSELLQVPLGCVTPFALVNDSARTVSLLLDQGFKRQELCFFHPLSNDMSIALNARDLDKFLTSIGKTPAYVDLEDDPTIGKDQPPDLADLVPSEAKVLVDTVEKPVPTQGSENNHVSVNNQPPTAEIDEKPSSSSAKGKSTGAVNVIQSISYADTAKFVEEIWAMTESLSMVLEKTKSMDLSEIEEKKMVSDKKSKFRAELKDIATMFKNNAYTEGFKAGTQYQPNRK